MSYNKLRLLLVACTLSSDWIKLCGSHAVRGSYVTCWKSKFALGRWNAQHVQILMQKGELLSTFCDHWFVVSSQVDSWVVKQATLLFNSFCSSVAKQDARVCCPLYSTFRLWSTSILGSRDLSCAVSGFGEVLKVTRGGLKSASCLRTFVKYVAIIR